MEEDSTLLPPTLAQLVSKKWKVLEKRRYREIWVTHTDTHANKMQGQEENVTPCQMLDPFGPDTAIPQKSTTKDIGIIFFEY